MKRSQTQKGFTLIELIVVLAIVTFLAAMAVGAYLGGRETSGLRNDVRELHAALYLARTRAISSGVPHGVAFQRRGTDEAGAYMIFMDCNGNGVYDDSDGNLFNNDAIASRDECGTKFASYDPRLAEKPVLTLTHRNYFTRILGQTTPGTSDLEYIIFNNLGQAMLNGALFSGAICIQNHAERDGKTESAGVRIIGGTGMVDTFSVKFKPIEEWKTSDNCDK